ncbi:hypothetical protein, partial [Halioglobus sp. HI00S01]|uniref:hypothetical protein n=1 Tax=Halioglobus sp. HI00S01 TaxID=1822214 RepID=UPI0018D279BD
TLVGVHTFQTLRVEAGASVNFGDDRVIVIDPVNSVVDGNARLMGGQFEQSLIEAALVDGRLEFTGPLSLTDCSLDGV